MKRTDYTLGELAEAVGTSPRTVRFYIARGLLPGPVQAGRNARYDASHLQRLERIGELKQQGLTLAEIGLQVGETPAPPELPAAVPMEALALSDDVQVLIRTDIPPWRRKQIRKILAQTARQLETDNERGRD